MSAAAASRPLAVTLGDPAGVGPEICIATWRKLKSARQRFCVIGDADVLERAGGEVVRLSTWSVADIDGAFSHGLPVLHRTAGAEAQLGRPDAAHAGAITAWIAEASALAISGEAAGVVTCPIAKSSLAQAGLAHAGHTEYLAALTAQAAHAGPRGPVMMLIGGGLRVSLATIHEPLSAVPSLLSAARIREVARVTAHALRRDFNITAPRIALCGLNPHAGEHGALGREEIETINPAAEQLRSEGLDISDALSADALFSEDVRARYDGVIAMYHDQGLIPVKALDFHGGVNATLGLPIVRTSPDHGTAYAIAGRGEARADSLIAAITLAGEMAARRERADAAT